MAVARIVQRYHRDGHQFVYLVFVLGTEELYKSLYDGYVLYAESGQKILIGSQDAKALPGYPRAVGEVIDNGNAAGKVTNKPAEAAQWDLDLADKILAFQAKDLLKGAEYSEKAQPVRIQIARARKISDPEERLTTARKLLEDATNAREAIGVAPYNYSPLRILKGEAKNTAVYTAHATIDAAKETIKENAPAIQAAAKKASDAASTLAKEGLEGTWAAIPTGVKVGGAVVLGVTALALISRSGSRE